MVELQGYLGDPRPDQPVQAIPGSGTQVPIWLLGSSLYSAQLAAYLGLPFAFASHFAPDLLLQALQIYRASYRPSTRWPQPHAMVGVNVVAAPTPTTRLRSTSRRCSSASWACAAACAARCRGRWPAWTACGARPSRPASRRMLAMSAVGGPATLSRRLAQIAAQTQADELIVASAVHDHAARLRSYQILATVAPPRTLRQAA